MTRPDPGLHVIKAPTDGKKTTDGNPPDGPPFSCVDEIAEIHNLSFKIEALAHVVDENLGDSLRLQDDDAARFGEIVCLLVEECRKLHARVGEALDRAMGRPTEG